jgi:hypothetical protein
VATLGLSVVRDKLDARFKLLTGGARTRLRRHQTLRAALEWSYSLLGEQERIVFRRLGVFAGGFSMEAAQALVQDATLDEWAVLDVLSALVDKSLVVADEDPVPRYAAGERAAARRGGACRDRRGTCTRRARAGDGGGREAGLRCAHRADRRRAGATGSATPGVSSHDDRAQRRIP